MNKYYSKAVYFGVLPNMVSWVLLFAFGHTDFHDALVCLVGATWFIYLAFYMLQPDKVFFKSKRK